MCVREPLQPFCRGFWESNSGSQRVSKLLHLLSPLTCHKIPFFKEFAMVMHTRPEGNLREWACP